MNVKLKTPRCHGLLVLPHLPCDSWCHVLNPGDFYRTSDRCSLWQSSKPWLSATLYRFCPAGPSALQRSRGCRPTRYTVSHPPGCRDVLRGPLLFTEPGQMKLRPDGAVLCCAETLAVDRCRKWLTKWRLKSADLEHYARFSCGNQLS